MSMVPYMTMHSEVSFDHDTIYDNDKAGRALSFAICHKSDEAP